LAISSAVGADGLMHDRNKRENAPRPFGGEAFNLAENNGFEPISPEGLRPLRYFP
jgi:hypothetical protein